MALSAYPGLAVIYVGTRVNVFAGIKTLVGLSPRIADSVNAKPDGLLLHEDLPYSPYPLNNRMRRHWRDYETLEGWTRSEPHWQWWRNFLCGGFEAMYAGMPQPIGMMKFAPVRAARRSVFPSRQRLRREGTEVSPAPTPEADFHKS